MSRTEAVQLAQLVMPFLVLAATWLVGQRVISAWDLRKKRRELDIAAAMQFQHLYGEAKEVARLWRAATKPLATPLAPPPDFRWQLHARATAVEGDFEAVVMKLVTERALSDGEVRSIGLFRQGCKHLRSAIQDGDSLASMRLGGGYTLFNNLAVEITALLARGGPESSPGVAAAQKSLEAIALTSGRDWRRAVEQAETAFAARRTASEDAPARRPPREGAAGGGGFDNSGPRR